MDDSVRDAVMPNPNQLWTPIEASVNVWLWNQVYAQMNMDSYWSLRTHIKDKFHDLHG